LNLQCGTVEIDFSFFRKAIISAVVPDAIWFVNKQPTLERTIFGLYRSLWIGNNYGIKMSCICCAHNAPMFPGFRSFGNKNQWCLTVLNHTTVVIFFGYQNTLCGITIS
jgi:hypothetical protein